MCTWEYGLVLFLPVSFNAVSGRAKAEPHPGFYESEAGNTQPWRANPQPKTQNMQCGENGYTKIPILWFESMCYSQIFAKKFPTFWKRAPGTNA